MKRNAQEGQSTIEFLMTFTFAFAFLMLFFKTAMNITNGFMVHYATFLASRTYLVWDNNSNTPEGADTAAATQALTTFGSVNLAGIFRGFDHTPVFHTPTGGEARIFTGIRVPFKSELNLGAMLGGEQELDLMSESFLLREPPRSECLMRICEAMLELGASECKIHMTLADNGC